MTVRLDRTLDRRQFFARAALAALTVRELTLAKNATAQAADDPPNTHNMLVVGERTIFASHLPMFDGLDQKKSAFRSPHRYQVILEVTFAGAGKNVSEIYVKDRQAHPQTRIYTLSPEEFVINRLFTPQGKPRLTTFSATVFRGHLELGGTPIPGMEKTSVQVTRVVHGRKFEPQAKRAPELEYILFGKGSELFLAHAIVTPPDFDHVLSVALTGHTLTDKDLAAGARIVIPNRKNVAAERLRGKQRVQATLQIGPSGAPVSKVQIEAGAEFYFEEGELLVPPTFAPTTEEKKG